MIRPLLRSAAAKRSTNLITVIQPYVPQYRVALFDQLAVLLEADGYRLVVAHGSPDSGQSARGDSRVGSWSVPVAALGVRAGRSELQFRRTVGLVRHSALAIAELASTNIDTYWNAVQRRTPLILWGHGRRYVSPRNRIDGALELWMARHADHLLLYTEGGAEYLHSRGISRRQMTVVQNSTDTRALLSEVVNLDFSEVRKFRQVYDLDSSHVVAFIGGLDTSKRIDLLLDFALEASRRDSRFRLIIAGDGPLRSSVAEVARSNPAIRLFPYADPRSFALIGSTARLCVMPGRVGLIAVDAMALGLPVVTTDWPFHAPEMEYLTTDFCTITEQSGEALAEAVLAQLSDDIVLQASSAAAKQAAGMLSIENMVRQMHRAVIDTLASRTKTDL